MCFRTAIDQQLRKVKEVNKKKRGRIRDLKLIEPLWHTTNLVAEKPGPERKGDIEYDLDKLMLRLFILH